MPYREHICVGKVGSDMSYSSVGSEFNVNESYHKLNKLSFNRNTCKIVTYCLIDKNDVTRD